MLHHGGLHGGYPALYTMNIDGAVQQRVTTESRGWVTWRAVPTATVGNPSGTIAASVLVAGATTNDIFLFPLDGSQPVRVSSSPANDSAPAWSPDGKQIAFISDRDGGPSLYRTNTAGTTLDRLAVGTADAPMGEAALLLEGTPATPLVNRYVLALADQLAAQALPGVGTAVPAINSLLVPFDPLRLSLDDLCEQIAGMLTELVPAPETPARVVEVPVRFGGADGPDLDEVAQLLGLAPVEIITLLCGTVLRVMMIGFTPGYPYIGPLPAQLDVPRRSTPRAAVPPGSVAIAAGLAGIYPAKLPGGWHLVGRTALRLFDPADDPPALLRAGDGVRFIEAANDEA